MNTQTKNLNGGNTNAAAAPQMKNNIMNNNIYSRNGSTSPSARSSASFKRDEESILRKLWTLKDCRILATSLGYPNEEFQRLEFYGDSYLGERISYLMFTTKPFLGPDTLTKIRIKCVCNKNLENCYEKLGIRSLLPAELANKIVEKQKADVVEAIIGELAQALMNAKATTSQANIQNALDCLISYIFFNGEQTFHEEQTGLIIPAANMKQRLPSPTKNVPVNVPTAPGVTSPSPRTLPVPDFSVMAHTSGNMSPPKKSNLSPPKSLASPNGSKPSKKVTFSETDTVQEIPNCLANKRQVQIAPPQNGHQSLSLGSPVPKSTRNNHGPRKEAKISTELDLVIPSQWDEIVAWSTN